MPRLDALEQQWIEEPPVNVLVAALLGRRRPSRKKQQKGTLAQLAAKFPSGRIALN
jgi:hypothetical protein